MIDFLKKPYGETESNRSKLISILVFGLFIFLFLFLFKPFGIPGLEPFHQLVVTFGFGLITTFMLLIFKFLLEPAIVGVNWTLGKNIALDFLIASSIGAANYFYICLVFDLPLSVRYLLFSIWAAILVGSIPVTLIYLIKFNRRYRYVLKEASIPDEVINWENEVIIRAGNAKNEFRINPKNIIYLCSNDNYVTIVTIKGESTNKTTIRGTLKAAESELRKNSRFLRCHKCYVVNLDFAGKIIGHNQNMKIRLNNSSTEIPVSRLMAKEVEKRIRKN